MSSRKRVRTAVGPLLHVLRAARDLSAGLCTDDLAACLEPSDLALIATLQHFLEAAQKASPSSQPWNAEEREAMLVEPVRTQGRPSRPTGRRVF
jgi:hypothetical protein